MNKNISIVFLVFNEEGNIQDLVERSILELKGMPYEYNMIIVNNASTDKTGEIIDKLAEVHSFIRIIHHTTNLGYAMSTLRGFKESDGEIVFIIDGDGQITVTDIPAFISKIESGYDIVYGWRVKRIEPFMRILLSRVLSIFAKVLLKYPYNDINCGYRAVTRKVAEEIEIHHKLNAVGPEIYVWGKMHNCKIAEVPVKHFPRQADSSIFVPWTIPGAVLKIIKYLLKLRKELHSV